MTRLVDCSYLSHKTLGSALLLATLLTLLSWSHAEAEPVSVSSEAKLRQLLSTAAAALQAGDLREAESRYQEAYRQAPAVALLHDLGRVARAQQRSVAAADLFRRYCQEAGSALTPETERQLQAFIQEASGPSTNVAVYGPEGSLVQLDGRLVGLLPLSLPLLVSPGSHQLRIELRGQLANATIVAQANRPLAVRFTLIPPLAVVTPTFAAVLVAAYGKLATPVVQALNRAVLAGAAEERVVMLLPGDLNAAFSATPGLAVCLQTVDCQETLANRVAAHYVLRLHIDGLSPTSSGNKRPSVSTWRFALVLHDVPAGAESAAAKDECINCTLPEAAQHLRDLVSQVVRDGSTRPEGTLEVVTVPAGAKVLIDGRNHGPSPVRRITLGGRHQVLVEAPGYRSERTEVTVVGEQLARVLLSLTPQPVPPRDSSVLASGVTFPFSATPSQSPPHWLRQPGKWMVAALGITEVIAAATLWGLDGYQSCAKADLGHCHWELDGRNAGIGMLVAGGATLGVTGLLFYFDARRTARHSDGRVEP